MQVSQEAMSRQSFQPRPWGGFEVLHEGEGYKIKRLYVFAGEKTSLQMHCQRREVWVVESGTAKITMGETVFYSLAGANVNIAQNVVHRIENAGAEMLVIFEVQFGETLCEDDIIRLDDKYGRV